MHFFTCPIFAAMDVAELKMLVVERKEIPSLFLHRTVIVDFYLPKGIAEPENLNLLLINDGQDLPKMPFDAMLEGLLSEGKIKPIFAVGIHCSAERKMEYGTAGHPDYAGRGAKADAHQDFVLHELLPYINTTYHLQRFATTAYAGFSLGGLSALDAVWHHPQTFSIAAVFSGSLWWRSKDLDKGYDEDTDRIMHSLIREGTYHAGQKFFFSTGALDESADRNNNGVIDSIDDTLALIAELEAKGYNGGGADILYLNYEDGKHDVPTWARAFPHFLMWAFGK